MRWTARALSRIHCEPHVQCTPLAIQGCLLMLINASRNANSNRRNGKPASCEPCRLNKTKCDHGHPKCGRCQQRGIEDRCFYHPAPLTRPRNVVDEAGTGEARPPKRMYASRSVVKLYE